MELTRFIDSLNKGDVLNPIEFDRWERAHLSIYTHFSGEKDLLIDVIDQLRPSEHEDVRTYRKENVKPVTKQPILDVFGIIKATINEHSGRIKTESEKLLQWADESIETPAGDKRLLAYLLSEGCEFATIDPNGYTALMPFMEDEELPSVAPDSVERKIKLVSFSYRQVKFKNKDCTIFEAANKWKTELGNKEYYWWFDKKDIYRVIPKVVNKKIIHEAQLWYNHNIGVLPLVPNGGHSQSFEETIKDHRYNEIHVKGSFYESYFEGAMSLADEYLQTYSDAKVVYALAAHPIRVIDPPECHVCRGNGKLPHDNTKDCDTCEGQGYVLNQITSIAGMVIRRKKTFNEDGSAVKPIEWLHAPEQIVSNFVELESKKEEKYKKALHLIFNEGMSESGESRKVNRQGRDAFIGQFGENVLRIYEQLLNIAEGYLVVQPQNRSTVVVQRPIEYSMPTSGELLQDLKDLSGSDSPVNVKGQMLHKYTKKINANDPVAQRIADYLICRDPLYGASDNDVMSFKTSNPLDDQDVNNAIRLHSFGYVWLKRLAKDNQERFLEYSDEKIDELLAEFFTVQVNNQVPIPNNEPSDATLEDVLTLLLRGEIERADAFAQIAEIEGVSIERAEEIANEVGL